MKAEAGRQYSITTLFGDILWELNRDDYDRIRRAAILVHFAVGIEEKLDILLLNYEDIEQNLRGLASRLSEHRKAEHEWTRRLANKLTANLLNTARMYCDHLKASLSGAYDKGSSKFAEIGHICSAEYDATPAYRIVDALRNYVQHRELPVETVHYLMERDGDNYARYSASFAASAQTLSGDRKFKKLAVPPMLAAATKDGELDLPPLLLQYVIGLMRIHVKVRALIAEDLVVADRTIREVRAAAEAWVGPHEITAGVFTFDKIAGLALVMESPTKSDRKWISVRSISQRLELEAKNPDVDAVRGRYSLPVYVSLPR